MPRVVGYKKIISKCRHSGLDPESSRLFLDSRFWGMTTNRFIQLEDITEYDPKPVSFVHNFIVYVRNFYKALLLSMACLIFFSLHPVTYIPSMSINGTPHFPFFSNISFSLLLSFSISYSMRFTPKD